MYRDRFISVAQRIQVTERHKGHHGRPWEYGDFSDMDLLEHPDMSPGMREVVWCIMKVYICITDERDASFMYGADVTEQESTFMVSTELQRYDLLTTFPPSLPLSLLPSLSLKAPTIWS